MKRIMIDLETISTFPNAGVVAIALVMYDDKDSENLRGRTWYIDPDFVIGHNNPETRDWWNDQDPNVRKKIFGGNETPRDVFQSVNGFVSGFIGYSEEVRIYADPANFDFPILKSQYQALGLQSPWSWRDERCLRTMKKELADNTGIEIEEVTSEIPHDPMHDCLAQVKELKTVLQVYRSLGNQGKKR